MEKIPSHLGIILDGNRRWAKERGLPASFGHKKAVSVVDETINCCKKNGIKILALFAFSTENWKRSEKEVSFLMELCERVFSDKIGNYSNAGIKVKVIGQKENLSENVKKVINELEEETSDCKEMILNIALSYGGRAEIVSAIKNIINKKIPSEKITEDTVAENLWVPDLDLLIRTGKEQRISNFLIWQTAYSELIFLDKYWPEFTNKDLEDALKEYSNRKRRFGE